MKIYYRISDAGYKKAKLPGTNKSFCLNNFLKVFDKNDVIILGDNIGCNTYKEIISSNCKHLFSVEGNAGSFRVVLEEALKLDDEEVVYFVEDDYLHRTDGDRHPCQEIIDGLTIADYVTLYDHPDKYTQYYNYGEISKVLKTKNSHWKHSISTTMTFASKVKTLKEDKEIFEKHTSSNHPNDHDIFCELAEKGKKLAVSIPGLACHTDLTVSEIIAENLIDRWAMELVEKELIKEVLPEKLSVVSGFNGLQKLIILEMLKKG